MYVFPCVVLFLCFSVLLVLRLPRLGAGEGGGGAGLGAFRAFVRFVLVWICRFPLPLGVVGGGGGGGGAAVCGCGTPWTFLLPFLGLAI